MKVKESRVERGEDTYRDCDDHLINQEEDVMSRFYGDVDQLNETDKFLWEYVNNDGWVDQDDAAPSYKESSPKG